MSRQYIAINKSNSAIRFVIDDETRLAYMATPSTNVFRYEEVFPTPPKKALKPTSVKLAKKDSPPPKKRAPRRSSKAKKSAN